MHPEVRVNFGRSAGRLTGITRAEETATGLPAAIRGHGRIVLAVAGIHQIRDECPQVCHGRRKPHGLRGQPRDRRVTDGEPHDIDIYDRRYLVEDARRAVLEACRLGLAVFCVTLNPATDDYFRAIFGTGNYRILDRIESLPKVLPAMVLRLVR